MNILITGAQGFVGRVLTAKIIAQQPDASLILFDAAPPQDAVPHGARIITGDLTNDEYRRQATEGGVDVLFHLAAIPGGAAEANYALSRAVNVDATLDLLEAVAQGGSCPRVVYASTIAVLGDPLPAMVDDATPFQPTLTYGAHKLMIEIALADFSRRKLVDSVALRLPGIIARPAGASGMKSAFMSNVFHALRAGRNFVSPVSADAAMWMMSVEQCADNLLTAASVATSTLPVSRAVILPALRLTMAELVATILQQVGGSTDQVSYEPDAALERAFGAYPPLQTDAAFRAGFKHDGDAEGLVRRVLSLIARS